MKEDTKWHLDKTVPLAIIFTLACQTLFFIVVGATWRAETDGRISALERVVIARDDQESRIVVVEQRMNYIAEGITEIKSAIRSLSERTQKVDMP
jgi:hypothetical protein